MFVIYYVFFYHKTERKKKRNNRYSVPSDYLETNLDDDNVVVPFNQVGYLIKKIRLLKFRSGNETSVYQKT